MVIEMHAMLKGAISFGLVNIPIKMYAATEDKDIRFRSLHKKCHTPIKYKKTCPLCNEDVGPDDIVRGFEYEPGKFVIITDEDMNAVKEQVQAKTIEIVDFVRLEEIDPIYYIKTYYIAPQAEVASSATAFVLLREAMRTSGRIAVARLAMHDSQTLCVLRISGNAMLLETIYYPDEIRPASEVPALPETAATDAKQMDIAQRLIDSLTTAFDPAKYTDEYREALRALIDARIEGRQVVMQPQAQESNVIDLMEALKASLKKAEDEALPRKDARAQ